MSKSLNESSSLPDRGGIATEQRNPRTAQLHSFTIEECVGVIQDEDRAVLDAVRSARQDIIRLLKLAEPGFASTGRLIYIGAGTSGRLGVLDASEAPPTFQSPPGKIVALIAGGDRALTISSEHKEDDPQGAAVELMELSLTPLDTLLGIAAGGTTPYVLGSFQLAKQMQPGCLTCLLSCSPVPRPPGCDLLIVLPTGPEVLTGSTRMKAGTATKMVLNTISTTLMIRTGKVYSNLMVDVRATNAKLRDRAARILTSILGTDRECSLGLLDAAQGDVKAAVVMYVSGISIEEAKEVLQRFHGNLHHALESVAPGLLP